MPLPPSKQKKKRIRFKDHKSKWLGCQDCEYGSRRKNMCFGRGKLPCDVLFVGEAPGQSEDVLGIPFVGPAGIALDGFIQQAMEYTEVEVSCAFTNLIACIPKDENNDKVHQPKKECINACQVRLQEFFQMADPYYICVVGLLSEKWLPIILPDEVDAMFSIIHPAAILRMNEPQKGLAAQKTVVTLSDVFEEIKLIKEK